MAFSLVNKDLVLKIKSLSVVREVSLSKGTDNLDQISFLHYNSFEYWSYLATFNNILDPFGLISQGFTTIKLFNKTDLEKIL